MNENIRLSIGGFGLVFSMISPLWGILLLENNYDKTFSIIVTITSVLIGGIIVWWSVMRDKTWEKSEVRNKK